MRRVFKMQLAISTTISLSAGLQSGDCRLAILGSTRVSSIAPRARSKQARATPWERPQSIVVPALKGRELGLHRLEEACLRPCRAQRYSSNPLPRALPWAGLLHAFGVRPDVTQLAKLRLPGFSPRHREPREPELIRPHSATPCLNSFSIFHW